MRHDIINHLISQPPKAGHSLHFARLDGTESIDHRDFYDSAERVAAQLHRDGVGAGDRVGVLGANCLEWALLDLAVLRLGAVTVGFELGKFDPEPALLAKYGLKALFTDRPATRGVRDLGEVRRLADLPGSGLPLPAARYAPEDMVALKLTSGTTGEPKGMGASAGSINSSLNAVQAMFAHGHGDNVFVFLPLSLLQQRYWIYSALYFGHDVTVSTYEAAFPTLSRVKPTVVMGVPAFFDTAMRHIEAQAVRAKRTVAEQAQRFFGPNIRYLWTGSAPASAATLRFFDDCMLPIFEGYGLNETCIVAKNYPGSSREGSVGRVLPGKQVLLDENGVISVRCDYPVSTRYEYAKPGESERVFPGDGVVQTNDLGYFDEDGFLYIRGRADDVIVLENGKKVIVRPLEEEMKTSPAIEECVIFCPTSTHLVAVVSPATDIPDEAAIALQLAKTNASSGRDEQISNVIIAGERFSVANGMLTSQFKPKRKQIAETYRAQINDRQRSGL